MFASNRGFSWSGYRMMSVKFYYDRLGLPMVGVNGPPIGNHPLRVLWLRDQWRHDLKIFEAQYVGNRTR